MKTPLISGNLLYRKVFVGRDRELSQLKSVYDSLDTGQGILMMVVGEPGIGKTAVCSRLSDYVTFSGGKTLTGTFTEKLGNIEPTGRKVNIKIGYFYRFENGKQVEVIPFMDRLLFYEQLGFTPPYAQ